MSAASKLKKLSHSLSLRVPSSSQEVGCHGTPFLSTFCHSDIFHITHAAPIHHITCPSPSWLSSAFRHFYPSISSFCFPFPRIKCPKYCCFLSCIVLRSVCFALAISKTSKLVFLSRCDILNMCRKIHISKALILSSICLSSVHDSEAYKKVKST